MKELENKIREALTRLKEIGVGLKFIDKLDFKAKIVYENVGTSYYFSESDNEVFSITSNFFSRICKETIGHPIKLNDVLEYVGDKFYQENRYFMMGAFSTPSNTGNLSVVEYILWSWDLSSVFLADQSDELKEFLNNL